MRGFKRFVASAAIAIIGAGSAFAGTVQAATATIGGIDYNVTTVEGTFAQHQTLLENQVWWGDRSLANSFAGAVAADLGFPNNSGFYGPLFAYKRGSTTVTSFNFFSALQRSFEAPLDSSGVYTYATAAQVSSVPLPAGGLLLLTGIGGAAALKRRKKRAA